MQTETNCRTFVMGLFVACCLNYAVPTQNSGIYNADFNGTALSRTTSKEAPVLREKKAETVGDKSIYTYELSYMNEDVVRVLQSMKKSLSTQTSVAFVLTPFQIDAKNKTIRVGIKKGQFDQKQLMGHLQQMLTNRMESTVR